MTKKKKTPIKWRPEKVSVRGVAIVTVRFTCPLCEKEQEVVLKDPTIIGGCCGHEVEEYCYCTTPHYEENAVCSNPECAIPVEIETGY